MVCPVENLLLGKAAVAEVVTMPIDQHVVDTVAAAIQQVFPPMDASYSPGLALVLLPQDYEVNVLDSRALEAMVPTTGCCLVEQKHVVYQ